MYPIPNFTALDQPADNQLPDNVLATTANINTIFLSINRYERKKNLPLALYALGKYNCLMVQKMVTSILCIIEANTTIVVSILSKMFLYNIRDY